MVNMCSWVAPDVTLIDGVTVVKSDSEAWRFECEARHILKLPTRSERVAMLEGIGKRRGEAAKKKLSDKILEIWQIEKIYPERRRR